MNMIIILHPSPALVFHKLDDFSGVTVFVISYEEALEFRNVLFGNYEKPGGFADKVVVSEDYRCALVTVVENLRLHTIETN